MRYVVLLALVLTACTPLTGTLRGTLAVGPLCPVERVDNPCVATQAVYDARPLIVMHDTALVAKLSADAPNGTFTVELPVGRYTVAVDSASAIERSETQTVEITAGEETTVDFTIDTGMR